MLSEKQIDVLRFIFSRTPLSVYNNCVNNYKTQYIYDRKSVIIVNEFFNGSNLKYSVFMSDLFNNFINSTQEVRAKEIDFELIKLAKKIKIQRKLKKGVEFSKLAKNYNALVSEHNECTSGLKLMKKYYKKFKPK